MATARYWRLVGIETVGGGDLELSAIALYAGAARVDGTATLTCSHAPTAGALANLQDTDIATTARFDAAAVRSGGFYLQWDFGSAVDIGEVKLGGVAASRFMACATLMQAATLGDWVYVAAFAGATYPGDGVLTASSVGGLAPTVWSSVDKAAGAVLSNGDLTVTGTQEAGWARSVFGATAGKWYWEISSTGSRFPFIAIAQPSSDIGVGMAENAGNWAFYGPSPYKGHNGSYVGYGTKWTSPSQIVGVALDMDAGTVELFMNGISMGVMYSGITGTIHAAMTGDTSSDTSNSTTNFGATAFAYTPPAGFNAGFGPTSLLLPSTTFPAPHTVGSAMRVAASSAVPDFSMRQLGRIATARDVEFGGQARIWGTTKIKGTPNVPTKARVVLQHQRSKVLVRETWSDPVTGAFEFSGLDASQQFLALAEDLAGNFRPVAASKLVPEVLA